MLTRRALGIIGAIILLSTILACTTEPALNDQPVTTPVVVKNAEDLLKYTP